MYSQWVFCRNRVIFDDCSERDNWDVKWYSEPPFIGCLPIRQEILNVSKRDARVSSANGSDSSVGGVPVVNCPDVDHMEEEVQVRFQAEEEEIGETHGEEQGEEQRVKEQTIAKRG